MATIADLIARYGSLANAPLPAGMRNNNPGNLIWYQGAAGQPGVVGPSVNTDNAGANHQIVFDTPESGMAAAIRLASRKYNAGKTSADALVAGEGGWTPGNHEAAANIARTAGVSPTDDLNLNDPNNMRRFMRGLITQEHGSAGNLYPDSMLAGQPQMGVGYIKPVSPLDPQYATKSGVAYPGSNDPNAIGTGKIGMSFVPKAGDEATPAADSVQNDTPAPVVVANLPNYGLGAAFAQALGSLTPRQSAYSTAPLQGGVTPLQLGDQRPKSQAPMIV